MSTVRDPLYRRHRFPPEIRTPFGLGNLDDAKVVKETFPDVAFPLAERGARRKRSQAGGR
jgi:hypothetical protein